MLNLKLIIVLIVSIFYFILMGYVLANVRRLKITTFVKIIIALVSIGFAPAGFIWYKILRRRDLKREEEEYLDAM